MPMKRTGNRGQKALLSVQDVIKQKESGKSKAHLEKGHFFSLVESCNTYIRKD